MATLDLNGRDVTLPDNTVFTASYLTDSANVTNNGSANAILIEGGGPNGTTYRGTISDGSKTTGLTHTWGSLTINGSNSYSGGTIIQNGNVTVSASGALGTGSVLLQTPTDTPDHSFLTALTLGADNLVLNNDVLLQDSANLSLQGNSVTFRSLTLGNLNTIDRGSITTTDGITFTSSSNIDADINGGAVHLTRDASVVLNQLADLSDGVSLDAGSFLFLAGSLGGTSDVEVTGPGTLDLSSTALAHTGGLTLNSATLVLSVADVSFGTITSNSSKLQLLNSPSVDAPLAIGSGTTTIEVDSADSATLAGIISGSTVAGSIAIEKTGTGELTLSNTNTYSGRTVVNAGTLVAASNAAFGTGDVSILNGGKLTFAGASLSLANSFDVASGGDIDLNGFTETLAQLALAGGVVENGTLSVTNGLTLSNGSNVLANFKQGAVTVAGGTNYFQGTSDLSGGVTISSGVLVVAGQLVGSTNFLMSGGQVSFDSSLDLSGHTGGMRVSGTTLGLNGNIGSRFGAITASNGAGFILRDGVTVASALSLSSGTTVLAQSGGAATWSGLISGGSNANALVLEKIGSGKVVLSGAETFTGVAEVYSGTLELSGTRRTGTESFQIDAGGSVKLSGAQTVNNLTGSGQFEAAAAIRLNGDASAFTGTMSVTGGSLALSAGSNFGTHDISLSSGTTLTVLGADRTVSGAISGAGMLNVSLTSGMLTVVADNSYSGGTSIFGNVSVGAGGTSGSLGSGLINILTGSLTYNRSDDFIVANNISSPTIVPTTLVKQGAGVLTLTGTNSYYRTDVQSGTLQIGNGGTAGTLGTNTITVETGATLVINHSDNVTISNLIQGSGSLDQAGSGKLSLAGHNTFTGGTTLHAGIIDVASTDALGTGALTFASGAQELDIETTACSGGDYATSLKGFGTEDTIDLLGIGTATSATLGVGNVLTVAGGGATAVLHFDGAQDFSSYTFSVVSDGSGGTKVTMAAAAPPPPSTDHVIADGTTLNLSTDQSVTSISGNGTFRVSGGVVTVTGDESGFTGDTEIAEAKLVVGADGTTGSLGTGNISLEDGILSFHRSDSFNLTNHTFGSGTIEKFGAGTMTVSNFVSTDELDIEQGAVQMEDGSSHGGFVSIYMNAGTSYISDRSDDFSFGSDTSGAGTFEKRGAGTLTLVSDLGNDHVLVSQGILQAGDGDVEGGIGSADVSIAAGATLQFNRPDDITISNTITGDGAVGQIGGGKLTLSGHNTYTGGTLLSIGSIDVTTTDALGTGHLTFDSGAQELDLESTAFTSGTFANVISGFSSEDSIDIHGLGKATAASLSGSNVLTLTGGTGTVHFNLDSGQDFSAHSFVVADDGAGGTLLTWTGAPPPPPPPPPPDPDYFTTTDSSGHLILVVTLPGALVPSLSAGGIDTVAYSGSQSLTLPNGFKNVVLSGPGNGALVTGNAVDNHFTLKSGQWVLDGHGGQDVLQLSGSFKDFKIDLTNSGYAINGLGTSVIASGFSSIQFSDVTLVADAFQQETDVISLYGDTFGRHSDVQGQTYWQTQLGSGATIHALEALFAASTSFEASLGSSPNYTALAQGLL